MERSGKMLADVWILDRDLSRKGMACLDSGPGQRLRQSDFR
jgi:hypothetical protein